ncbi:MAG: ribonuclease H-like domain-containing protein [Myxococcota bacterium]
MDLRAKLSTLSPVGPEGRRERLPPAAARRDREAEREEEKPPALLRGAADVGARLSPRDATRREDGATHREESPLTVPRRHYPDGSRHGRVTLSHATRVRADSLALLSLDPRFQDVDPTRLLFIDTETTGLHGGAGTLPFLIGLGWYEGGDLHVEQHFLPRPGHEGQMLRALAERMRSASVMVTFNGKCFDWPLLRTRLVMNRLPVPEAPAHLDLLHCARRLLKRRLATTRLQDLERQVLGFRRLGDIDSALIPAAYFDYLRRGATAVIRQVLEHNVLDVVTMAAVLAELARRVETACADDGAEDLLSVAELLARAGQLERAETLALSAAEQASLDRTALAPASRTCRAAAPAADGSDRRITGREAMFLTSAASSRAPHAAGAETSAGEPTPLTNDASSRAPHAEVESSTRPATPLTSSASPRTPQPVVERATGRSPGSAVAQKTALEAWWLAARLAGKRRDWAAVAHRLNTALGLPGLSRQDAQALHLALARVCEHRLKDSSRALVHARSAVLAEPPTAHARRVARLTTRLASGQTPLTLE